MISINVELYGAFKSFGTEPIRVNCPTPLTLKEFKPLFKAALQNHTGKECNADLIADSAFANDEEIIHDHFLLSQNQNLSVLPPVCGG